MNNLPPISSPTGAPAPLPPDPKVDLPSLARAQKWVLWGILANIITVVLSLAMQETPSAHPTPAASLGLVSLLLIRVLIAFGVAVATWHLARALKLKWAILTAISSFFPLVGLIVLLSLNSRATAKLRGGGYDVGLLGAKLRRNG